MRSLNLWNDDWSMLRDFDRLQGTVNRLFSDFGRSYRPATSELSTSAFTPPCDIQETAGHYVMNFDLPGMTKENIHIEMEDNQLTISGERKTEERHEDAETQRIERAFGAFKRSFTLPFSVETDKIEANYENGVLTLVLPKVEAARPREIKINEGRGNILDRVFGKKPELKSFSEASKK